jgi:hypothetical protein
LWHIGKVLGLKGFSDGDDETFKEYERKIRAAERKDRKAFRKDGCKVIRGVLVGEENRVIMPSEAKNLMFECIRELRKGFEEAVIHRGTTSKDCEGNFISGLPPYREYLWVMDLYPWEYKNIDSILEESEGNSKLLGSCGTSVSRFQDFQLSAWQSTGHCFQVDWLQVGHTCSIRPLLAFLSLNLTSLMLT